MTLKGKAWHDARDKSAQFRKSLAEARAAAAQSSYECKWVLVAISKHGGVEDVYGPFSTQEEANNYADYIYLDNFTVVELYTPARSEI